MDAVLTSTTGLTKSSVGKDEKEALQTALAVKWASAGTGFAIDKLEFSGLGQPVVMENSLSGVVPDLKLEFKGDDQSKGELYGTYKVKQSTVKAMVDIMNQRKVEVSAVSGHGPVTFGALGLYTMSPDDKTKGDKKDLDLQASVGYKGPNFFAGVNTTKMFKKYEVLASFAAVKDVTVAGKFETEIPKADAKFSYTATAAVVYQCNPKTILKAKVDTNKVLDLSVKQTLDKKFVVSAWAQAKFPMEKTTFGLKAVIG